MRGTGWVQLETQMLSSDRPADSGRCRDLLLRAEQRPTGPTTGKAEGQEFAQKEGAGVGLLHFHCK